MHSLPQLQIQTLQQIRIRLLKKVILVQVKVKSLDDNLIFPEKSKSVQKLQRRIKIALFDHAFNSPHQDNDNKTFTVKLGKLKAICRLRFQRFSKYPLTSFKLGDKKVKRSYQVCPQILFLDITLCSPSYIKATKPSPKYLAGIKPTETANNTKLSSQELRSFMQIRKLYSDKYDQNYFKSGNESVSKATGEEGSVSKRILTLEKLVFNHGIRGDVELMQNLNEGKFFKKCNFNFAEYQEPLFKMNIYEAFRSIGSYSLTEVSREKLKKMIRLLISTTKWRSMDEQHQVVSLYNLVKNKEMRGQLLPLAKSL